MTSAPALLSTLVLAVGLALLVFMVTVESEPGALPLLLIALGLGWKLVRWRRARSRLAAGADR